MDSFADDAGRPPGGSTVEPEQTTNRTRRLRLLSRVLRSLSGRVPLAETPKVAEGRRAVALCRTVLAEHGEASSTKRAGDAVSACRVLTDQALDAFFDGLVDEFSPDKNRVIAAATTYRDDPSVGNLSALQAAVESPREELFRRFNMVPGGTAALIELRQKLLRTIAEHPERSPIDKDLVHLFRSWFNGGFLVLRRIDWRTPATVLERLIRYEAVHQIQGWRDLRRRLEADRRCYAFFHPALPDEPLIFIEVALTKGMAAAVQPLIDADAPVTDPGRTDTAMFYSITNCQAGLRGVSFGHLLIKQAVEDLRREFPRLRRFATISPLPGFVRWLQSSPPGPTVSAYVETLLRKATSLNVAAEPQGTAADRLGATESHQRLVISLAAHYLLHAKRGNLPLDPVARFHLANGARVERLNWMGDQSTNGLRQSLGLTVNYVYRLKEVERNHEAYATEGTIARSHEIHAAAKTLPTSASGRSRRKA